MPTLVLDRIRRQDAEAGVTDFPPAARVSLKESHTPSSEQSGGSAKSKSIHSHPFAPSDM